MTASLPPEVRALLAAVRDAVDVPIAVGSDREARLAVLDDRARYARIALEGVLVFGDDLAGAAERLAERTAETPITYAVYVLPEDRDGIADPDFFQPGRTYMRPRDPLTQFRCVHSGAHPKTGHRIAWGWHTFNAREPEWTSQFFWSKDFGDWTEATEDGAS